MIIGNALDLVGPARRSSLSIALAFLFGYAFTSAAAAALRDGAERR